MLTRFFYKSHNLPVESNTLTWVENTPTNNTNGFIDFVTIWKHSFNNISNKSK